MPRSFRLALLCAALPVIGSSGTFASAADTPPVPPAVVPSASTAVGVQPGSAALPTKAEVEALIRQAQEWQLAQAQANGAFVPGNKFTLGITALSVLALTAEPAAIPVTDPRIEKAIALITSYRQPDGGVYVPEEGLGSYCTSLALMVWAQTKSGDPAHVRAAQDYLFGAQNAVAGSINQGGIGYGSRGAGNEDLSNTTYAITALRASGVPAADPRMQEALRFLERCQNLSAVNKLPWVNNDGGAVYSPDESKAGGSFDRAAPTTSANGEKPKLVSYGSMTYALISNYLTLDLKRDDPRVAAALAWVRDNYRFDANPGMAKGKEREGLFYYYGAMAKTYDLIDGTTVDLKDGRKADWRADLFASIKAAAKPTPVAGAGPGALWINDAQRWGEGAPHLTTSYMIQALKRIHSSL